VAKRVCDYVNRLCANDPNEVQFYSYGDIANDLRLTFDEVAHAIRFGGGTAITLKVDEAGRRALAEWSSNGEATAPPFHAAPYVDPQSAPPALLD
jgi:hypothetical protein